MAQIVWSTRSLKDIEEIANYIAKDSLQYAEEQVRQFFIRAKVLEKQPLIGRIVPELKLTSIRQILSGHYRIIYEVLSSKQVGIITIHHQSRLLERNPAIKKIGKSRKKK